MMAREGGGINHLTASRCFACVVFPLWWLLQEPPPWHFPRADSLGARNPSFHSRCRRRKKRLETKPRALAKNDTSKDLSLWKMNGDYGVQPARCGRLRPDPVPYSRGGGNPVRQRRFTRMPTPLPKSDRGVQAGEASQAQRLGSNGGRRQYAAVLIASHLQEHLPIARSGSRRAAD